MIYTTHHPPAKSQAMNSDSQNAENASDIPSADIVRLILAHLTESGLHSTCTMLRRESGLGMAGIFPSSKGRLVSCAEEGQWGEVLEILDYLDIERYKQNYVNDYSKSKNENGAKLSNFVTPLEKTLALAHEMTVLELADHGEYELAYAALRMCSEVLDRTLPSSNEHDMDDDIDADESKSSGSLGIITSRTGDIERRITALNSIRTTPLNGDTSTLVLPPNFYGASNQTQQKRRNQIAKLLKQHVPVLPLQRLSSLLQQSVKWQCHTGLHPTVQRLLQSDTLDENEEGPENDSKKKKKRKKQSSDQRFDLVLGNVDISVDGGKKRHKTSGKEGGERIPSRPTQTVRLGKKSYIESAMFLPDGRGLVTGSSDGFIEIWGEPTNKGSDSGRLDSLTQTDIDFEKLRTFDLVYQKSDDLMMHDAPVIAMDISHDGALLGTASSDGMVCVWKIMDGKLLRKMERAHGGSEAGGNRGAAVSSIHFSPDGSKILTGGHDHTCREFGLLTSRMLKEFRGHKSYVNCCNYVPITSSTEGNTLAVVTGSADGKIIVWDAKTAEATREISPPIALTSAAAVNESQTIVASKSIHTVLHLHSPSQTMIVVPRSDRAYLMTYSGNVLRVFIRDDTQGSDFLAASVSTSNQWLYVATDDGKCIVFDINTGSVEKIVRDFAEECSTRSDKASEISGIISHPHRGMIGGFCNDKSQKRGILTLWK